MENMHCKEDVSIDIPLTRTWVPGGNFSSEPYNQNTAMKLNTPAKSSFSEWLNESETGNLGVFTVDNTKHFHYITISSSPKLWPKGKI